MAIIKLKNASYHIGGQAIVSDACWSIEKGAHWAVLGPNGSGKTTLLRLACGYIWPTGGSVLRLGRELMNLAELRRSIGWISSELVRRVPVHEPAINTVVAGRFAQVGLKNLPTTQATAADFDAALEQLTLLGMPHVADRPFGVLSQGEKQVVLIARARMAEPLLLVLDEPCAGMDPGARERFLAALQTLLSSHEGPTTVLVTHHVEEIIPALTQTLVVSAGRIATQGPTQDVVTKETLGRVYGLGVSQLVESGGRLWPVWE